MVRRWRVLGLMLLLVAACGDDGGGSTGSSTTRGTSTTTARPEGIEEVISLEGEVFGIEAFGDLLWVESGAAGVAGLSLVDASRSEVVDTIEACCPTVIGEDLWIGVGDDLVRADARTGDEVERVTGAGTQVCVADGTLWVLEGTEEAGEVVRRSLPGFEVQARVPLPAGEAKAIGCFAGAVWVPVDGANVLVKVDPSSNEVTATVPAGLRPHSLAFEAGDVWVIDHGQQQVQRVDAASGTVEATIQGVGDNVGIVAADGFVWATTKDGIAKIDPDTNEVVDEIELGFGSYYDLAVADGSLWVTTEDRGELLRVAMP